MNSSNDIHSRIQNLLETEEEQNEESISVYDVLKLSESKDESLKTIKKKYLTLMRKEITSKISDSAHLNIGGFNYDTKELIIYYNKYFIICNSESEKIIFCKKDNDLCITNRYRKNITEELLLAVGEIISELYDKYIDFENFYLQKSLNIKSVNSNLLVDINKGNIKIFDNLNVESEFALEWDNIFKKYEYVCNSYTLLNFIQGKEEVLLKKVFVKINDCPKWMQKQLYETRKIELLSLESNISKKEKAYKKELNNYERLLNEIKYFLNKKEVSQENTLTEVISLFELYNIVNDELEDLRNIFENSELEKRFIKSTNIFCRSKLDLVLWGEQDRSRLRLFGYNGCMLDIYKDKNINEIYFDRHITDYNKNLYKFVKKNYDLILETLLKLEEYEILIGNINAPNSSKVIGFDNNLFKVSLSYDTLGKVFVNIEMNGDHELEKEYYKKWYERENICDFVNKNKDEVLKRVPVDPYELDESFKKIYDRHKEKLQQEKVKEIRKSKGI